MAERIVWTDGNWLLGIHGDELFSRKFDVSDQCEEAAHRWENGESPKSVIGWAGQRLALAKVRQVDWVPEKRTLLVWRHWMRDPWRIPFDDPELGHEVFVDLAKRIGDYEKVVRYGIGPNDLQLDPKFGVGVFLAFVGVVTVILGAIEGVGQGPNQRFRIFAELGEEIGIVGAVIVGVIGAIAGVAGLIWWWKSRPEKLVVRRESPSHE